MNQTQAQVKVKVILPEMVCRNCKRFYVARQDGRGIQISTKVITGFDGDSAIWNCRAFKAQEGG